MNFIFLEYFNLVESIIKDIIKTKSTDISSTSSEYSTFLDYIHLHFIQNKCPYGSFFVFKFIIEDNQFISNIEFSLENAEKLIKILRRYINDVPTVNQEQSENMLKIFLKLNNFLKKSNKIAEFEELCGLFIKWNFYFCGR